MLMRRFTKLYELYVPSHQISANHAEGAEDAAYYSDLGVSSWLFSHRLSKFRRVAKCFDTCCLLGANNTESMRQQLYTSMCHDSLEARGSVKSELDLYIRALVHIK